MIALALFLSWSAAWNGARAGSELIYKVSGQAHAFVENEAKKLLITSNCEALTCEAGRAWSATSPELFGDLRVDGGRDPGAAICTRLKGKEAEGIDSAGRKLGLCAFRDGSYVSTASLHSRAVALVR